MNGSRKSDSFVVPEKPPNKGSGAPRPAEGVEGRRLTKGNPVQQNRRRTQGRGSLHNALDRIRIKVPGTHLHTCGVPAQRGYQNREGAYWCRSGGGVSLKWSFRRSSVGARYQTDPRRPHYPAFRMRSTHANPQDSGQAVR